MSAQSVLRNTLAKFMSASSFYVVFDDLNSLRFAVAVY